MNNEIQQIAQQNDMSIEFVRWFFNEKKAACGEQWFLALGAMWEGWKAREGEMTALALTIEKSREASGCPAGVDLQDWVKQLAAESLTLKAGIREALEEMESHHDTDGLYSYDADGEQMDALTRLCDAQGTISDLLSMVETPATDRIVAGIKADGVEEFISMLREGADK
ncbi:hypothetical protein MXL28_05135 [Klebsiella aerogenes]|uniref:hypothetical protein n=1 Tax=Klebsiella aerogenes TaxID=548 RepID=UPI002DC052FB|nr:hypothetical protein [Klebsiella aerogenes]MEB6652678.1 hypothetical protein [Klebsiella aerogenes]